jgi:hypothetical protein
MLGDLSIVHAHGVHGLEADLAVGWRHAEEDPPVRPVIGLEGRHDLARLMPAFEAVGGLPQPQITTFGVHNSYPA